jgi:glycosyltransferase involved in cell wall biosynthesis
MGRPKIGIVVYANPDYYPPTVNAIHLLAENYDITLIGRNQEPPDRQYPDRVKVYRLGVYSSVKTREKASILSKLREYVNFVKETNIILADSALIYVYDPFSYVAICLSPKFTLNKVPIIYHHHETSETIHPLTSLSGWIQRLEKLWINRAATLVFPDLERAEFFQTLVTIDLSPTIVPNFPLKSYFTFDVNWETLIAQRWQNIVLFYRGTISHASAMKEMVASASFIARELKIQFVGFLSEANAAELTDYLEKNSQADRFNYLGIVTYEQLQPYTLDATVGFALYKNTSFDRVACATACNKIYEYAACGLPIIVSDFPSYRNYLSGESWVHFADPEDPKSIALAIEHILSDFENYRKMCLAARQAFEEKFNYETVFSPILHKIEELIKVSESS